MKSIRLKLISGLSLIILFFLAQAAFVIWNQNTARTEVVDATRKNTVASSQLGDIAVLAQQLRRYEKEYFVYIGVEDKRNNYIKEWTAANDKLKQQLQAMRSNESKAFVSADLSEIEKWTAAADFYAVQMKTIFDTVNDRTAKIASQKSAAEAVALSNPKAALKPAAVTVAEPVDQSLVMLTSIQANDMIGPGKTRFSDVLIKGVSEMSKGKTKATLALSEVAGVGFDKLLFGVLISVAAGVLIALALMFTLPKSVNAPLAKLTASVENISKGNLGEQVESGNIKEFDGLTKALERLRLSQKTLVAMLQG